MTFRELLEKYKNQTATPEERKQVEAELEKYNALTEYLLEQDVDMEGEDLAGQQEELQKIDRSMKNGDGGSLPLRWLLPVWSWGR